MVAYNDGDIISIIKSSIISSNLVMEKFTALFAGDAGDEKEHQQLLVFVIEWYANMQGTYFVRHLKGNSGDHMKKLIDNQSTRTKVANAAYRSKVVSELVGVSAGKNIECDGDDNNSDDEFECDATLEHQLLWQSAEVSVLEFVDTEVEDDNIDNE